MGSIEAEALNKPPTKLEYDFEGYNWNKARDTFKTKHKDNDRRQKFLQSQTTGNSVKATCMQLQNESESKYFQGLGGILSKIDTLMKVGDLAIKSAPESVGLAWMGVRMCLHAVQGDFATFQLFSGACADIIGIMISCRVYGKMYGGSEGPEDFQELHSKVVDYIPNIYADILDFSYAVRKYIDKHVIIRIGKNVFKDVKGDFQGLMDGIQAHETKMRDFAKIATDRLLVHFQKQGLKNQDIMQSDISFMKEALDANLKANEAFVRHIELLEKERKDMRKKTPFEKAKEEFEDNKRTFNPSEDQSDMLVDNLENRREKGTCRWIFELDEYVKWHDSTESGLLWVSGAAGYGKSILMSTVIESLQAEFAGSQDTFVQYFFCKTGDDTTQTTTRILQTVAFHLYERSGGSPELLEDTNESLKKTMPNKANDEAGSQKKPIDFEAVYGGLLQTIGQDVFLVIDAIDECNDRRENNMLQDLRKVVSAASKRLKILVCSRPEADIADALNSVPSIKCENHNEADIRKSVTAEMNKFPGWTSSEKARACDEIVQKAGGQFRYVQIALDFLRKPLVRPYERTIEKLPDGLTGSYITSWKQTDPDYIGLLKTALTWTVLAAGKVKVTEVMDAYSRTYSGDVGIEEAPEDAVIDEDTVNLHDSQVRVAGGNFLDVSSSSIIGLRHATVKDFFLQQEKGQADEAESKTTDIAEPKHDQTPSLDWNLSQKIGQLEITKTIVQNLASPAFQKKYLLDENLRPAIGNGDSDTDQDDVDDDQAEDDDDPEVSNGTETLDGRDGSESLLPNEPRTNGTEALSVTSPPKELGLTTQEVDDLSENFDASGEYEEGEAYFSMKNQNFRYELIYWGTHLYRALLLWPEEERSKSPEWEQVWDSLFQFMFQSPEAFHAWQQLRIFDLDSNLYTGRRDTEYSPLQVACTLQIPGLVKALIERGVDINERTTPTISWGWRQTPLEIVAQMGNIEIMRLLLEKGADPNSSDNGPVAFSLAVEQRPTHECIKMFLDHGANVNHLSETSDSVMHCFSDSGTDPKALRLLLDAGADINAKDMEYGETPLHRLMQRDDPPAEVLEVYLHSGAQINIEDRASQRPLYEAAQKGLVESSKLLIEHGADIHDPDDQGITALHAAARAGRVDVVKLLLEKGAVINRPDHKGRTPLYLSCQGGHEEMSKYLIDCLKDLPGDEINKSDKTEKTPLRMAAAQGSVDTIRLLLEKVDAKAVINAKDSLLGQTCVHSAAFRGRKAALEVLLSAGGDPSVEDNSGNSPLQLCGQGWYERMWDENESALLYLIDRNEDIAAGCPDLLFVAAIKGSARVVERLLDAGVNPNSKDKHGWTALLLARQNGQQPVVDVLMARTDTIKTKPTSWASTTPNITISDCGLLVAHNTPTNNQGAPIPDHDGDMVVSDHPIPAGQPRYYFEVDMVSETRDKSDNLPCHVVGMTTLPARLSGLMPGHPNPGARSWGWHGDDGFAFSVKEVQRYGGGPYSVGDVVGCAVDFDERVIFFVRNGERFDTAFTDVWGRLYPAVGALGSVELKANFGGDLLERPFVWEGWRDWVDGK